MDILTDYELQILDIHLGPNVEADEQDNFSELIETLYNSDSNQLGSYISRADTLGFKDLADTIRAYIDRHRKLS